MGSSMSSHVLVEGLLEGLLPIGVVFLFVLAFYFF